MVPLLSGEERSQFQLNHSTTDQSLFASEAGDIELPQDEVIERDGSISDWNGFIQDESRYADKTSEVLSGIELLDHELRTGDMLLRGGDMRIPGTELPPNLIGGEPEVEEEPQPSESIHRDSEDESAFVSTPRNLK